MKKKLIKKYQSGGTTRQYSYGPLPSRDKWNGISTIKDISGKELNPGDLVLSNSEGKMITKDNTQAYLDYLAANNIPIEGPILNQLTVSHNKNTGETKVQLGEDFEDRLKRLQQDPIANDEQLKQLWLEQGEQQWNQSHDKHVIDTRAADRITRKVTPGALSIMSPAILGGLGVFGRTVYKGMKAGDSIEDDQDLKYEQNAILWLNKQVENINSQPLQDLKNAASLFLNVDVSKIDESSKEEIKNKLLEYYKSEIKNKQYEIDMYERKTAAKRRKSKTK